jgi:2-keto-3-deoxy-L-rhamnonate aldolase RhmA
MNTITIHNPVKKALLHREVTLGTWMQFGHPGIAEVFANAGFDWIAVDCEHTDIGIEGFAAIARGIYGRGPVPLVRVRENDTLVIRQVLDAGAQGVIVPLVNTAEDAQKAVAATRFPPEGIRGFAFFRANDWGTNFDDYAQRANRELVVIVMIETKEAVENIDAILAVDGIDGVLIGPYDMSGSYGVTGQTSHPLLLEARQRVVEACQQAGKSAGLHDVLPTKTSIKGAIAEGFTLLALGMDNVFIDQGARHALHIAQQMR